MDGAWRHVVANELGSNQGMWGRLSRRMPQGGIGLSVVDTVIAVIVVAIAVVVAAVVDAVTVEVVFTVVCGISFVEKLKLAGGAFQPYGDRERGRQRRIRYRHRGRFTERRCH